MISKSIISEHFDAHAANRPKWFRRNYHYHEQIIKACRKHSQPQARVLEVGCSTGDLLAALQPAYGLGVDLSPRSIEVAQRSYPHLHFVCADAEDYDFSQHKPFDLIVLSDLLGYLNDIQGLLEKLRDCAHAETRIVISHWNWMWQFPIRVAEALKLKQPDLQVRINWLSPTALNLFLALAEFERVDLLPSLLFPLRIPLLFPLFNALGRLPVLRRFTLEWIAVATLAPASAPTRDYSVTVVVPTRNERENVAVAIDRIPMMGTHTEILFIDGNSTDGTVEAIHEQITLRKDRDIRFMPQVQQPGPGDEPPDLMLKLGKGDAVRKAFAAAQGEILMILDADLTVPPEDLPRFYRAIASGKADFINGTRLVYQQEDYAMKLVNRLGNIFFSYLFSWLLGQHISDTLCGTKVLYKLDYDDIVANRSYFGDFDPFGDYDLLFGASRLGIPICDLPIRYRARVYGDSKVRVGLHGPLLLRMSAIAFWRLKVQPVLSGQQRPPRQISAQRAAEKLSHPNQ